MCQWPLCVGPPCVDPLVLHKPAVVYCVGPHVGNVVFCIIHTPKDLVAMCPWY